MFEGKVSTLLEWAEELLSKMFDGVGDWVLPNPFIFKNLGFGIGLEPIYGGFRFQFRKIWSRKKVSVLVSENLVSDRKNQNNKKEKTKYNKQCKSFI